MLLSRNYPPSPALAPYIARHYVFSADLPADFTMIDRLLSETAFIRILLKGDWSGEIAGNWVRPGNILFFGANSRPLRVRVKGPFHVIGIALRPCGWKALCERPAADFADNMLRLGEVWGEKAEARFAGIETLADDGAIVEACESSLAAHINGGDISEAMQVFEYVARNDSTMRIEDVARLIGLSTRQLERQSHAYFGHMPKMVLRRSRFLDMATVLRGLGDPTQDYLAALRYFDQSHKAREFRRFIDMTPSQFEKTPTPLLTAGLELRHERKLSAAKPPSLITT